MALTSGTQLGSYVIVSALGAGGMGGRELFYVSQTGAVMRVGVEPTSSWAATPASEVVKEGYFTIQGGFPARSYDVSPDGQRFLMIKIEESAPSAAPATLIVVQHGLEELTRRVPRH